jgi:O-antigen ligase
LMSTQPRGSARRVWIALGAAVSALGFLGTLSRGGLVSAGFVLVAAPLVVGRWRARALAAIVVAAGVIVVYFGTVASTTAVHRVTSSGTSGRSSLWKVGIKMFEANPILGVGSANFQPEAVRYVQQTTDITRADLIVASPHVVHNTYLEAADDLGIPGLVMLLLILLASLRAAWQAAHRYQRAGDTAGELLSRTFILALLGILAADFFIVGQYSKQLWLLLALGPVLLALAPADGERGPVPPLAFEAPLPRPPARSPAAEALWIGGP